MIFEKLIVWIKEFSFGIANSSLLSEAEFLTSFLISLKWPLVLLLIVLYVILIVIILLYLCSYIGLIAFKIMKFIEIVTHFPLIFSKISYLFNKIFVLLISHILLLLNLLLSLFTYIS